MSNFLMYMIWDELKPQVKMTKTHSASYQNGTPIEKTRVTIAHST